MTEKFDKRAGKNGGIPSGSAGRHSDDWDDFLTEFRSDGDIAVRSLEDLGLTTTSRFPSCRIRAAAPVL